MLPSNEMEKTATSDDYNSNHFQDATLLCLLIFQKQESREMPHTNLTGLIRKLKGRYAKPIFSVEAIRVLKKTTVRLTPTNPSLCRSWFLTFKDQKLC